MAYFANGSEGSCFDEECMDCVLGDKPCPVAMVQELYNYDAVNNETATKILAELVKDDGTCQMKVIMKAGGINTDPPDAIQETFLDVLREGC